MNHLPRRLLSWSALPTGWLCLILLVVAVFAWTGPVAASAESFSKQDAAPAELTEEERESQREAERQRRIDERNAERAERNAAGLAMYEALCEAYLTNQWETVEALSREIRRHRRALTPEQRREVDYITRNWEDYRPDWWENLSRSDKNSFRAGIWGREFWANYWPTDELGLQAVRPKTEFNRRTGELEIIDLEVIVTWKPHLVDNEDPAGGRLAKIHDVRLADLAEFICWHELGHNYITENIPTAANIELYENYGELYSTLHEYFADLTALYHCSPRARRVVLMFRLGELDAYDPDESHRRGEHGIGAILVADMLENPDAWPSVRFPPSVPEQQVELNTIIYIYEHLAVDFTVAEDIRLRELAEEFVMRHGERTFRSKGVVRLPNRLEYNLMVGDDREAQRERDAWVAEKLEELAAEGRVDVLAEGETYDPPVRTHLNNNRMRMIDIIDDDDPDAPLRIKVPWND